MRQMQQRQPMPTIGGPTSRRSTMRSLSGGTMKDMIRTVVFMTLVVGLFVWAVQVLDWLIQEERTYRRQRRNEERFRRYG